VERVWSFCAGTGCTAVSARACQRSPVTDLNVKLLLLRASTMILASESHGTHDSASLTQSRSQLLTPPTWRTRSLYLCPPVTRCPVIPPGTRFHFRRLLRLARLRWRYSNPPPPREKSMYSDVNYYVPSLYYLKKVDRIECYSQRL
jgi:hypothetical protein